VISVSVEEAYREACLALGEAVVRERLLSAELARREAEEAPRPNEPTAT
jgi:hypothetical protein